MAELAACYTGRERPAADCNLLVYQGIGEVIRTLGHGADEDAYALLGTHALDIIPKTHQRRFETERDLPAVGRQVISNGVLDHSQQLIIRVGGSDRQSVQQLNHETCESLERSGNSDRRGNFDEDALGGVNINLQLSSLVDGRIKKRQEALDTKSRSAC